MLQEQDNSQTKPSPLPRALPPAEPMRTTELISVQPGAVVSRVILKKPSGNVTVFSMDEGQGLTEHTSPYDALVQIIEGESMITVQGAAHRLTAGEIILLPANHPHTLMAITAFKMILTMIRS